MPNIVPKIVPLPPLKLVPPKSTAAITISSKPFADPCCPVSISEASIIPATPTNKEVIIKPISLYLLLLIPDKLEENGLLPIAVKYLPYLV